MLSRCLRFFQRTDVTSYCGKPSQKYTAAAMPCEPFRPIFITGFPRSGTTLLAATMDRHSAISITPETYFFTALKSIHKRASSHNYDSRFVQRLMGEYGLRDLMLRPEDVCAFLNGDKLSARNIFRAILMAYQHRMGTAMIGEKTPSHIMEADKLLKWYPQSRMIFVLRDGRDAVASLLNMPWRSHGIARLHAVTWRRYVQIAQQIQRRYPDRFILVKYEDILSQPNTEIRRLDEFCGIKFEPRQIDATIQTHVVPQWEEPWKLKATHPIDTTRVGHWRTDFTVEEKWALNHTMSPYLQQFGYEDYGVSECPPVRRLWLKATGVLLRTGETRRIYRAVSSRLYKKHHPYSLFDPYEITPSPAALENK